MNLVLPGPKKIQWVDVFALALGVSGSVSSVSLYFDLFHPGSVIGVSVVLTVVILGLTTKMRTSLDSYRREGFSTIQLLIAAFIGGLALIFRWGPYRFEQGGQDQGLYVNMATTLSRWGSVRFPDAFRQSLDAGAQAIYDETRLASYYLVDSSKSLMTIEFYPLHPALMSLSQSLFGGLGLESLTIISLLGVLGAWYLAKEIDGRTSVANLFALFFAINPVLGFFSKFPASESIALTFVVFGMLYLIRFVRAVDTSKQILYLLTSLFSFNSLFYVRWQFLLYIPFFAAILLATILIPSYRNLRNRMVLFSTSAFLLFTLSMLYYMKKQPELYQPVRDSLLDMLPISSPLIVSLTGVATGMALLLLLGLMRYRRKKFSAKRWNLIPLARISPYVLLGSMFLAIPSIVSLYAGESMYPWGYRVPADVDSWVIRYHAGYRLALFVSPVLFAIVLFGGLKKPVRNNITGLVYVFSAICFMGILMRPAVPYLYYYGRYLVVDLLPAFLLLGAILLVNWMTASGLTLRLIAIGLTISVVSYSLFFSSVLLNKYEGEDAGFYSAISAEVKANDILIVSSVSQQVMVPLRARYNLNVLAVPDSSSGFSSQDVFNVFGPIAAKQGGRLLYLVPNESTSSDMSFVSEYTFTDNFFTNTDHFRGDGLLYLDSWRRLLLPTRWQSASVTWQLFQINSRPLLQR